MKWWLDVAALVFLGVTAALWLDRLSARHRRRRALRRELDAMVRGRLTDVYDQPRAQRAGRWR